jgi:2-polyprenyl-3-methyl-5-hydroxy-6-metoxy-1,4-benzoquinol methylase
MRPGVRPESPVEAIGLALNLAPLPVVYAFFGMMSARTVMAGVRLRVFERLAQGPGTLEEVANGLGLDPAGTRHLLESLAALDVLKRDGNRYSLARRARKWLDPASDSYVGAFIDANYDQWEWWSRMEELVQSGETLELHTGGLTDAQWQSYIRGQFDLARLSGPEVAKALRLPDNPTALLDAAGGHGWFSAELCRRHPGLRATVVDLPQSAVVGREIIAEQGMSDRVQHVEGDLFEAELGGPYDAALAFNIIHHFDPDRNVQLLERIRAALKPDGKIAVLDLFTKRAEGRADASAFLGMHFWLTSGAATYAPEDLQDWLTKAGFGRARRVRVRSIPVQTLYEAPAI